LLNRLNKIDPMTIDMPEEESVEPKRVSNRRAPVRGRRSPVRPAPTVVSDDDDSGVFCTVF